MMSLCVYTMWVWSTLYSPSHSTTIYQLLVEHTLIMLILTGHSQLVLVGAELYFVLLQRQTNNI